MSYRKRAVRAGGLVIAAIVLLGAAGGGARDSAAAPRPLVTVVVAARGIAAGEVLVAGDIRMREIPDDAALGSLCRDATALIGRRVDVAVGKDDLLTVPMLAPRSVVPPASRVVSLAVDARQIASGARVGDQVEVVAAVAGSGDTGNQVVSVASGRVLAIDGPGGGSAGGPVELTIACTGPNAMRIVWAQAFAHSLSVLLAGREALPSATLSTLSEPG